MNPAKPIDDPVGVQESRIREFLRSLRRAHFRHQLTEVSEATLWVSVLLLGVAMLLLGGFYHGWLRVVLWTIWLSAVVEPWIRHLVAPRIRRHGDAAMAALLERQHPHLRNDLTSSLEFGALLSHPEREDLAHVGSPDLMGALVHHTAQTLDESGQVLKQTLPRHPRPRLRKLGLVGLLVVLATICLWPDLAWTGLARMFWLPEPPTPPTVGPPPAAPDPLVASLVVTYRYPSYTRRPSRRENNPTGRIETLAGTEVTIEALSLREIRRATLVLHSGETPEAAVITEIGIQVAERDLRVTFSPLSSGTYQFCLEDRNGQHLTDPVTRHIAVIPDEVPQVQLVLPEAVVEAAPNDVIPFQFTIADDFGVTEVAFVRAFAADTDQVTRNTLVTLEETIAYQDRAGFDLAPLALQPADEVLIWVEAVDNDTISGPKAGRSRPVLIRITSAEDRHLALIAEQARLFEALLEVLGDYLEHPIADLRRDGDQIRFEVPELSLEENLERFTQAAQISRKVDDLVEQMHSLLAAMEGDELLLRRDYELFRAIYVRLAELHRLEQEILSSMNRPAARGAISRYHLERIQPVRDDQVRETERSILTLEELIDSQRMESLTRTLEELGQIQDRLRQLLEEYRQTRDPQLRAQIERELMRLQTRMRDLLARLAEQMAELPEEHYNLEALQEMGMLTDVSDMTEALERIRQMLDSGDIEGALAALDDLEAQVQSLFDQVSQSQSSGGGAVSQMDRLMSELVDEINNLAAQEREIEQDTGLLQEQIRQRRISEIEQQLSDFIQEARQQVAHMREQLASIDGERLRADINRAVERADGHLETLDERLEQERIELALEAVQSALERLSDASFELRIESRHHRRDTPRARAFQSAFATVQEVSEQAQSLAERLEDLVRQAAVTPGIQDWDELFRLARSQGLTLEELSQLLERVAEMSQEIPLVGSELSEPLQEVNSFMEGARRQLLRGQLPGAREDEQAALQRLRQLRQAINQMVARERMGRRLDNILVERVEIPAEPDETPAEFREDILQAMKEQSIEAYREVIRRYYQSLVQ